MNFNLQRAMFWLFVGVVACIMYMAMGSVTMCWFYAAEIVAGTYKCDPDDRVLRAIDIVIGVIIGQLGGNVVRALRKDSDNGSPDNSNS